jgi:HAD superfamily phosphoserine phosphatase-like hydrolase
MTHLVFFDLDGTLIDPPSSEKSFLWYLFTQRVIGWKQYLNAALFALQWASSYKQYVFIKDKAYLADLPVDYIIPIAKSFTREKLLPRIRPSLKKLIEIHRQANDINILLTGAHDFIAEEFAKYLGMDEMYASQCVVVNDHFTNAPLIQHPFRNEKLTIAKQVCNKHKIDIKDTFAYANSINDKILLCAVGHPVAITPDHKLKRIAEKEHWQIIYKPD